MRTVFVPLILAGLALASCSDSPPPGTGERVAKANASVPQMPRKIVDLSPTLTEDFAIRNLGHRAVEMFGLRERTEFEHVIAVVGYQPPDNPDEYPAYPSLSGEAAEYLATLPVRAFATDMCCLMSYQDLAQRLNAGLVGSENVFPEHYAFMSRGIPAIEALVHAEDLIGEEHVVFVGFPLKLKGATGGLMRAAALVY